MKDPIFIHRPRKSGNTPAAIKQLLEDDSNYLVVQHHLIAKELAKYLRSINQGQAAHRILTARNATSRDGLTVKNLIIDELPKDSKEIYMFIQKMQRLFIMSNAVFAEGDIFIHYSNHE